MGANTTTALVNTLKQNTASYIMATPPDWRALAYEQLALVAQREADIERISKEQNDARTEVTRLHLRIAEQDAAARNNVPTRQLEQQIQALLQKLEIRDQQAFQAEREIQRLRQNTTTLQTRLNGEAARFETNPAASQQLRAANIALQQSRKETQQARQMAAHLSAQLQVVNKENAKLKNERTNAKRSFDCEDDDELDYPAIKKLGSSATVVQSAAASTTSTLPLGLKKPLPKPASTALPIRPASTPKIVCPPAPKKQAPRPPATVRTTPVKNASRTRRGSDDHIDLTELEDLKAVASQYGATGTKRASTATNMSEDSGDGLQFSYSAVTHWTGDTPGGHPSEDFDGVAAELRERIELVKGMWEEAAGLFWHYEFSSKQSSKSTLAQCVTKKLCGGKNLADGPKLKGGKTLWRPGCEGRYACRDCVQNNWPCFTWSEERADFLLLPLHKDDQKKSPTKGFEIRAWIDA